MADRFLAGAPAEAPSCGKAWDVGGGDRQRYLVKQTCVYRHPIPEARPTELQKILDQEGLLEMILQQFTREQARNLLASVSRQLAASVRDERVQWKPEDQLRVLVRGSQPKLTVAQLDGYMETLNKSMLDLDTLKDTVSDTLRNGNQDVMNSLLRAGIQPEGMAQRLANAISDLVLKEKNER